MKALVAVGAFNQEYSRSSLILWNYKLRKGSFSAVRVEVLGWFMVGCNVCIETSGKIHDLCLSKYTWQVMAAAAPHSGAGLQ